VSSTIPKLSKDLNIAPQQFTNLPSAQPLATYFRKALLSQGGLELAKTNNIVEVVMGVGCGEYDARTSLAPQLSS
jgi:hypothetical protein